MVAPAIPAPIRELHGQFADKSRYRSSSFPVIGHRSPQSAVRRPPETVARPICEMSEIGILESIGRRTGIRSSMALGSSGRLTDMSSESITYAPKSPHTIAADIAGANDGVCAAGPTIATPPGYGSAGRARIFPVDARSVGNGGGLGRDLHGTTARRVSVAHAHLSARRGNVVLGCHGIFTTPDSSVWPASGRDVATGQS